MVKFFRPLGLLVLVYTALLACGGSSSSGGEIRYVGTETVTVSTSALPGIPPEVDQFLLQIFISGNSVRIVDTDNVTYRGTIRNNEFTARGVYPPSTMAGVSCTGIEITYTGRRVGNTITGSSSGDYFCTIGFQSYPFTIQSVFAVNRTGKGFIEGGSKSDSMSTLLEKLAE